MEETNYHRETIIGNEVEKNIPNRPDNQKWEVRDSATEKHSTDDELNISPTPNEENGPAHTASTKSISNKLKIFDKWTLRQPNRLKGMFFRPLIFLSFPVIFYAGFSYGCSLIWFNVLNGTASLILSAQPYNFTSSTVGLAYLSPLIGITIGYPDSHPHPTSSHKPSAFH